MKTVTYVGRLKHLLFLGLLLGGIAMGVAEAGKPSSGPLVLEGAGGYVAAPLFNSADALAVVKSEDAWNPVTGYVSMSDAYDLRLTYGLEVDDAGHVYAVFQANGAATGGMNIFTGVLRYDEDTQGLEVVLARSVFYDEILSESNQGEFLWRTGVDRVPEQDSSAAGDLRSGDFIIARWIDTTDVTDPDSPTVDDRLEIVLFGFDTSGDLVEKRILYALEDRYEAGVQVGADNLGNVYLWVPKNVFSLPTGLYRLSYDAATENYGLTALTFPFETNQHFDTDDAGNLYVQGAFYDVIYRLAPGDDPQDAVAHASYSDGFGNWTADNASANAALAMHLRANGKGFVSRVEPGSSAAFADRIGESESVIHGITADANGSVYVAHEDRELVSRNQYVLTAYTIYRLDVDTSGGGDTGGGGKGGGKGKNK